MGVSQVIMRVQGRYEPMCCVCGWPCGSDCWSGYYGNCRVACQHGVDLLYKLWAEHVSACKLSGPSEGPSFLILGDLHVSCTCLLSVCGGWLGRVRGVPVGLTCSSSLDGVPTSLIRQDFKHVVAAGECF